MRCGCDVFFVFVCCTAGALMTSSSSSRRFISTCVDDVIASTWCCPVMMGSSEKCACFISSRSSHVMSSNIPRMTSSMDIASASTEEGVVDKLVFVVVPRPVWRPHSHILAGKTPPSKLLMGYAFLDPGLSFDLYFSLCQRGPSEILVCIRPSLYFFVIFQFSPGVNLRRLGVRGLE